MRQIIARRARKRKNQGLVGDGALVSTLWAAPVTLRRPKPRANAVGVGGRGGGGCMGGDGGAAGGSQDRPVESETRWPSCLP